MAIDLSIRHTSMESQYTFIHVLGDCRTCLGYFMCARQAKRAASHSETAPLALKPRSFPLGRRPRAEPDGSTLGQWAGTCKRCSRLREDRYWKPANFRDAP